MNQLPELPPEIVELLDGSDLERKIGAALVVIAVGDDGWPRAATVSVGEVLAVSPTRLLMTLYAGGRTTAAIAASGRVLLVMTHAGGILRVRLEARPIADPGSDPRRSAFGCDVVSVEHDVVDYARVTHGIEFELKDTAPALRRWSEQLNGLKVLAGGRA